MLRISTQTRDIFNGDIEKSQMVLALMRDLYFLEEDVSFSFVSSLNEKGYAEIRKSLDEDCYFISDNLAGLSPEEIEIWKKIEAVLGKEVTSIIFTDVLEKDLDLVARYLGAGFVRDIDGEYSISTLTSKEYPGFSDLYPTRGDFSWKEVDANDIFLSSLTGLRDAVRGSFDKDGSIGGLPNVIAVLNRCGNILIEGYQPSKGEVFCNLMDNKPFCNYKDSLVRELSDMCERVDIIYILMDGNNTVNKHISKLQKRPFVSLLGDNSNDDDDTPRWDMAHIMVIG